MRMNRGGFTRILAILLSFLIATTPLMTAATAEESASSTDLGPKSTDNTPSAEQTNAPAEGTEPPAETEGSPRAEAYTQTVTTDDGVKITVSADPAVLAPDTVLVIRKTADPEFEKAAEKELEITVGESLIIRHSIYSITGAEFSGAATVRIEDPELEKLKSKHPDDDISVTVLQRKAEKAERLFCSVKQNAVTFGITAPGLYDMVTVIRLSEPETEDPEDETPDETPDQTNDDTTDDTTDVTPGGTPDETTDKTDDDTPDEITDATPDETTDKTDDDTPDETTDVIPDGESDEKTDNTPNETPDEVTDTPDAASQTDLEPVITTEPVRIMGAKSMTRSLLLQSAPEEESGTKGAAEEGNTEEEEAPLLRGLSAVSYKKKGATEQRSDYAVIDARTTELSAMEHEGWYVVNGSVQISDRRLRVADNSAVHIILTDGASLTVPLGIQVPSGSVLNIYGQEGGTGAITSAGVSSGNAAIGGNGNAGSGTIEIYGGTIVVTGGANGAGIGGGDGGANGKIDIFDGKVTATGGGKGAGIGGGAGGSGGKISIYGGTVTANGTSGGAGIGGGAAGIAGTIIIEAGTITAKGAAGGAGIGTGAFQKAGGSSKDTISISNGTITATGGDNGGSGIGGGRYAMFGKISLTGGIVKATGNGGYGIGPGQNASQCNTILNWNENTAKTMQVTSGSYGGTVDLNNNFIKTNADPAKVIYAHKSIDVSVLKDSILIPYDETIDTWTKLQAAITEADKDEVLEIRLKKDITAESGDKALVIPAGLTMILDLNGHRLDRNLGSFRYEGNVITIEPGATLTIRDSSEEGNGVITGGRNSSMGGGVLCSGILNLEGGSIAGNKCSAGGGGIALCAESMEDTPTLNMFGGSVRNNTSEGGGGGISGEKYAEMTISGGSVTGNKSNSDGGGIYLGGVLKLFGGSITGNEARYSGGGIYQPEYYASLYFSNGPVVRNNRSQSSNLPDEDNIMVSVWAGFGVTGTLFPAADIGINIGDTRLEEITPLTCAIEEPDNARCFRSDHPNYFVDADSENRVAIGPARKITFVSRGGSGSMEPDYAILNNIYKIPKNEFTPPAELNFAGWQVNDGTELYQPGDYITITGDTRLTACFGMPYEDEKGTEKSAYIYTLIESEQWHEWENGWFVADRDVTFDQRVTVSGAVNLILKDGVTLKIPYGISVNRGSSLTIYAQQGQTGRIEGDGSGKKDLVFCAMIGGDSGKASGSITICGGGIQVTANRNGAGIGSGNCAREDGGTVTIHRGTVNATGGTNSAGIGGGNESPAKVVITGGTVTATGGINGCGIGSGANYMWDGSSVTITGGVIQATAGRTNGQSGDASGAGIGSSVGGSHCGTIRISGGTITARGADGGAGIGCGAQGAYAPNYAGGRIEISGGVVYAYGSGGNSSLGGFKYHYGKTILTWTDATRDTMEVHAEKYDDYTYLMFESSFRGRETGNVYVPEKNGQMKPDGEILVPYKVAWSWQTLQECIDMAEDGETIIVYYTCMAEHKTDSSLKIPEGKTITIDLQGCALNRHLSTDDAREDGSVIENYGNLTLISTTRGPGTLMHGNTSGYGGAIYNEGNLTVENVTFQLNKSVGNGCMGGAIYSMYGDVTLTNCTIKNNNATSAGGAIYNIEGVLTLNDCDIYSNRVTDSDGNGGAIFSTGPHAEVNLDGTKIHSNEAGMFGAGVYASCKAMTVKYGNIYSNTVRSRTDGKGAGGGIYAIGTKVTITDSRINENSANGGGGILATKKATITLKGDTKILGNTATKEKGGAGIEITDYDIHLVLNGTPVVQDNLVNGAQRNVYLANNSTITMGGPLEEGASVGVTTQTLPTADRLVEFTSELFQTKDKYCFTSDRSEYIVDAKAGGGAVLGVPATIHYVIGQNVGTKEDTKAARGNEYVLENCPDFDNRVAGITFSGWIVDTDPNWKKPGTSVSLTSDSLTLTAVFSVPYIGKDGTTQRMDCVILSDSMTSWGNGKYYGYAAVGSVTISGRVAITLGNITNLILCDGCKLDTRKGITVSETMSGMLHHLAIYGQEKQTGSLTAKNVDAGNAAIGGSNMSYGRKVGYVSIYGGNIDVKGGTDAAGIGNSVKGYSRTNEEGYVRIYRGTVTAQGGILGAGIGGGYETDACDIYIYGGKVTASGDTGIGGGYGGKAKKIQIFGGTVNATGDIGAGIGGGTRGEGGNILIEGGAITAISEHGGAGIGGGYNAASGSITITGGVVTARANAGDAGIGPGQGGSGGQVVLNWTDESKDTMRVTSNKYTGTVEVKRVFRDLQNEEGIILPGKVTDFSNMAGKTIIPCDRIKIYDWETLQYVISISGSSPTTVTLEADIRAKNTDTRILVSARQNIVLDLNGHTMDRNISSYFDDGNVITVESGATLTIRDSAGGGVIQGGKSTQMGGAIQVSGTLNLEGGTIANNHTTWDGGAVFVKGGAKMTMTGGSIEGNTASLSAGAIRIAGGGTAELSAGTVINNIADGYHGGAIYNSGTLTLGDVTMTGNKAGMQGGAILEGGTLNIQGKPVIQENTGESGNNLYLRPGKVMHVTGTLDETAWISVYTEVQPPVDLTSGLPGKGTTDNFVNEREPDRYFVMLSSEGEAVLGVGAKLSFTHDSDTTGTLFELYAAQNSNYSLPDCDFTKEGMTFAGWTVEGGDGTVIPAKTPYMVTGDIVFIASFQSTEYDVWVGSVRVSDTNKKDILGDGTAQYDPETKTLTLNGAAITNLYSSPDGRAGIYAAGDLTITGSGTIRSDALGIRALGCLTLDSLNADITIDFSTSMMLTGVYADGTIVVRNGSRISVVGSDNGLESADGGIEIHSSSVEAYSEFSPIIAMDDIVIDGQTTYVHAVRTTPIENYPSAALEAGYGKTILITEPLQIIIPKNGKVTYSTITDSTGLDAGEALIMNYIPLTGIRIEPEADHILTGTSLQMKVFYEPEDASMQEVEWTTSKPAVATVDANGMVTAVGKGETIITATSKENKKITAFATIQVSQAAPSYDISIAASEHGSVALPEGKTSAKEGEEVTLTVTPDEGYHLARLYHTNQAGKETDISETFRMVNKNIVIHAVFEINSYTVRFDANGGTGVMDDLAFTWGETKTLPVNAFTRTGSEFGGWNTAADGSGTAYADQQEVSNLTGEHGVVVTLYAQWGNPAYKLTEVNFDSELGTVEAKKTENIQPGETVVITVAPNTGYHVGSATYTPEVEGSSAAPMKDQTAVYTFQMPEANVRVDVGFAANTYTVEFRPGADDVTETMADQVITWGTETSLSANGFTRTGYTFAGWKQDGQEELLADKALVKNLTDANGGRVILTAQWTVKQVKLTFVTVQAEQGQDQSSFDVPANFGDPFPVPENPTREGHTFTGWNPELPARVPEADTTYTAKWTINQYTLTFDGNGGVFTEHENVEVLTKTQDYNTSLASPTDLEWTGHTFLGWDQAVPEKMPAANRTIKARWTINTPTIYFDTAGGRPIPPITQDYGTPVTAPENPSRPGYTFAGWDSEIPTTMPERDMTVRAKWTINQYTIKFNTDGGSAVADITQDYNTAIIPPANPTKEGYTFTGWNPALPEKMPAVTEADNTFTAMWQVNRYTLTFDPAGGSAVDPITQDYNTDITAPADPTRTGYTFVTWSPALPAKMPAENRTFTAQWTLANYGITISPTENGDVTLYPEAANYHYGDTITLYPAPIAGYRLKTLTYTANEESKTIAPDASGGYSFTMPAANVSVTATFEPIPVEGVLLDRAKADVYVGDTLTLKADIFPEDAIYESLAWSVRDSSAASVSTDGTVTGLAEGEAIITVTVVSGGKTFTASCTVTVLNVPSEPHDITTVVVPDDGSVTHGRLTAYPTKAEKETPVSLTAEPDEGYSLKSLTYAYTLEGQETTVDLGNQTSCTIEMPDAAVTATAEFAVNQYTIHFNTAGGSPVEDITQDYDTLVTAPANPTKEGYTFIGWNDAVPEKMPAYNMNLVARWMVNSYTITFDTDGGSPVDAITKEYGTAVTAPSDPAKEGYTFLGWEPRVPTVMPAGDMTVKAIWQVNRYTVTFRSFGGLIGTIERNYGEAINPPENPTAAGYEFGGWEPALPEFMPAENLVVRAKWVPVDYFVMAVCSPYEGTVAASAQEAHYGDEITVTALPNADYKLAGLTVITADETTAIPAVEGQDTYTFTMPAGHVIVYAAFVSTIARNLTVTVVNPEHGTITSDRTTANENDTVRLTVVPEDGWELDTLTYRNTDSASAEPVNITGGGIDYAFTMPACNVTVSATFKQKIYTITATATDLHGTVIPDKETATKHKTVEVTVTPENGYKLYTLTWTPEGGDVQNLPADENGKYIFTMPADNVLVRATFDIVHAESVTVAPATGHIHTSETLSLTANVGPENALNRNVTWISSDPSVATVDENGKVTGTGAGYVTITAVTKDGGFRAECRIMVEPETVTVSFEKGDAPVSGTMASIQVVKGDTYRLPNHRYTNIPDGLMFAGWKWNTNQYGATGDLITVSENLTLTAVWGYPVDIAETEHGTVTASPIGGKAGTPITLALKPDRGYRMPANVSVNGADVPVTAGEGGTGTAGFTMPESAAAVSAVFEPITYTVAFNANRPAEDADETGMEPLSLEYDQTKRLTANAYGYKGYEFAGWNRNADGSGEAFRDQQRVSGLADTDGATVNLYAQWKAVRYPITVYTEHGEVVPATGTAEAQYGDNILLNVTPDPGYTLDILILTETGKRGIDVITPDEEGNYAFSMPAGAVTLRAVFTPNRYTVSFDPGAENAEGTMAPQVFVYDEEQELNANAFTRQGYRFVQWVEKDPETGLETAFYEDGETVVNLTQEDAVTLTAQWKPDKYAITVLTVTDDNQNHGTITTAERYAKPGDRVTLIADPDPGYQMGAVIGYSSWFFTLETDEDGNRYFIMPEDSVLLLAMMKGNPYTVTFDANGGTGEMKPQELVRGVEENLSANTFTREHYEFRWWNTKADGTGEPYSDTHRVKDLLDADGNGLTLYAVWKPEEYTIIFLDGETELGRITDAYGTAVTAPEAPEKEGYIFDGWDPEVPETMPETPEEGLKITAKWKTAPTPTPTPTGKPTATPTAKPTAMAKPTATPRPTPTATPKKPSGGGGKKTTPTPAPTEEPMTAVAVLSVRAAAEPTDEPEGTGPEKLAGAEIIEKARKLYGKDYVLLTGGMDPADLPVEATAEAGYDALIPEKLSGAAELAALAEQGIPVLAANVYYDGTDGEHEAGENVFTPYIIREIDVNGETHRIGMLGLVNVPDAEESGFLFASVDNPDGTPAGEAALYLMEMRKEKCEFFVVCFYGDMETPEAEEGEEEPESPAELLAAGCSGIDLLITPGEPALFAEEDVLTDAAGKEIHVFYDNGEPAERVVLFRTGADGKLVYSLSDGGNE